MASGAGAGVDAHDLPTDDDLDHAVERALDAEKLSREQLASTLYHRAECLARQLHSDDLSLVPAWLRQKRVDCLLKQSIKSGIPSPAYLALRSEAWELQKTIIEVCECRAAAGTLVRSKRTCLAKF